MKQLRVLILPLPLEGMLVHRMITPRQYVAGTQLYTLVKRDNVGESILSKKQYDGRDLASDHRPSDLRSNALTTTPTRPHDWKGAISLQMKSRIPLNKHIKKSTKIYAWEDS